MKKNIRVFTEATSLESMDLGKYIHFDASICGEGKFGNFMIIKNNKLLYNIQIEKINNINSYRNLYIGDINKHDTIDFVKSAEFRYNIWSSNTREYTLRQQEYLEKFNIESFRGIKYNELGSKTPKKMVLNFPGYGDQSRVEYPFDQYFSIKSDLEDREILSVSLLDDNFIEGSWLLYNENRSIEQDVINLVKFLQEKYKISAENTHFYGISKGGTTALYYSQFFSGIKVGAFCPAMPTEKLFFNNRRFSIVSQAAQAYGLDLKPFDMGSILIQTANNNELKYVYGEIDYYFDDGYNKYFEENNLSVDLVCLENNAHCGPACRNEILKTVLEWT